MLCWFILLRRYNRLFQFTMENLDSPKSFWIRVSPTGRRSAACKIGSLTKTNSISLGTITLRQIFDIKVRIWHFCSQWNFLLSIVSSLLWSEKQNTWNEKQNTSKCTIHFLSPTIEALYNESFLFQTNFKSIETITIY